jgi:hypothetical protein
MAAKPKKPKGDRAPAFKGSVKPATAEIVGPNWGSPQARGLIRWCPCQETLWANLSTVVRDVIIGDYTPLGQGIFPGGTFERDLFGRYWNFTVTSYPNWFMFLDIALTRPFSVAAWVRPDQTDWSGNQREFGTIIAQPVSAVGDPWRLWSLHGDNSDPGKYRFGVSTGGAGSFDQAVSTSTATTSGATHLVGVASLSTVKIYVNGVEEASTASSLTLGTSTKGWVSGHIDGTTGNAQWAGAIYDLRIYALELSAAAVRHMYDVSTRWDLYSSEPLELQGLGAAGPAGIRKRGGGSIRHPMGVPSLDW